MEFLNAYKYNPAQMILYNLSMAHAGLGNLSEAYRAAERARDEGLMSEQAALRNDARLAAWHLSMTWQHAAQAIAECAPEPSPYSEPLLLYGGIPHEPAQDEAPRITALGWAGIGTGALGLGLLGYATYLELAMQEDLGAYEAAARGGDVVRYRSLGKNLDRQQTTGRIALYAGASLAAVGVGLLTVDLLRTDTRQSGAHLGLTSDGQGAAVHIQYLFP